MKEVSRLHGVPKETVSYIDPKLTSIFWKGLFKGFGTNINLSTTYHPESYGKTKRSNRIIEDMLKMYMMDQRSKWQDYIHLFEFSYNNGYQASMKMSPFEELHIRKCNTPVSLDNPKNRTIIGIGFLKEMEEKMKMIKWNFKSSQDRHTSYVEKIDFLDILKRVNMFF
jgi:hypothetical protein